MKLPSYILSLFCLVLLFSTCVREFDPPSQGYQNVLVVEALLTNGKEPFEVQVSRSVPIDTSAFIPERGATISLSGETGEAYNLTESASLGIYRYPGDINAQTGKSYRLHIQTQDGSQYESAPVTMRATPEIDSVAFRYEERPTADLKGVQIYVNTHDPQNNTHYYRWEWEETWDFFTPYRSDHVYENGQVFLREDNIHHCWKNGSSTSIDIATSNNLTEDIISMYPLLYVSTNSDRLGVKYSLNVKQYALNEESYNYWAELQKVTESLGTLFDPQPSIVLGNVYNINDKSEVVLGYFDAAEVTEKRIFIERKDLPPIRTANYFSNCTDSTVLFNEIEAMIKANYMLAYETVSDFGPVLLYVMSYPTCIDCTFYGTNEEPDFWK